jgi:probable rRNA maturation factor
MKILIELNNLTQNSIEESFFVPIAEKIIRESQVDFLADKEISISVAIVSEEEIRKINEEYRKKDSPTDVLSFSEYENSKELEEEIRSDIFLGEIILCYTYIASYATENGISPESELANVFSHGVLHLLGFDHGEKMFSIQKKVINTKNL